MSPLFPAFIHLQPLTLFRDKTFETLRSFQTEPHLEFIISATTLTPLHNNLNLQCRNQIPLVQTVRNSLNISGVEHAVFVPSVALRTFLFFVVKLNLCRTQE